MLAVALIAGMAMPAMDHLSMDHLCRICAIYENTIRVGSQCRLHSVPQSDSGSDDRLVEGTEYFRQESTSVRFKGKPTKHRRSSESTESEWTRGSPDNRYCPCCMTRVPSRTQKHVNSSAMARYGSLVYMLYTVNQWLTVPVGFATMLGCLLSGRAAAEGG